MWINNIKLRNIKLLMIFFIFSLLVSCSATNSKGTLASLNDIKFEVKEEKIDGSLEKAMASYEKFLNETAETEMTPEALRRLADLKIQKVYEAEDETRLQQEEQQEQQASLQNNKNIVADKKQPGLAPVADSVSQATDIHVPETGFVPVTTSKESESTATKDSPIADISEGDVADPFRHP